MMFTKEDKEQLAVREISLDSAAKQIDRFKNGFKAVRLSRASKVGDGILRLSMEEKNLFKKGFDNFSGSAAKFVPASGAATRMFKELFELKAKYEGGTEKPDSKEENIDAFFKNLESFGFYNDLKKAFENTNENSIEVACASGEYSKILDALLGPTGLNYGNLPKGLLKFHQYENESRTPVVEQLMEGLQHSSKNGIKFHFTVSPEHLNAFQKHMDDESHKLGNEESILISFSNQKPGTDTLAVDPSNQLFRDDVGSLLFRPAGHGALLENLNLMNEEIVFIKNIDNILPDCLKTESVQFKKILAGVLIKYQERTFDLLRRNERKENIESEGRSLLKELGVLGITSTEGIIEKLNRPIRVCGMVKNEGEPGGGPFWVREIDGKESLQIVEGAQVDTTDDLQDKIFKNSTHFNPVDLVCGLRNYKGEKFDLLKYRDDETGFITEKSYDGRKLKAMELPGLWNGSMADWNTIFVEVPLSTFSPVKTINDLLKKEHQTWILGNTTEIH